MKRNFILVILMLVCYSLVAVPAAPFLTSYIQEDGTEIDIYVRGDERLNWSETSDGYTLLNKNKSKYYAIQDSNGDLVVSDIQANNPENRSNKEREFLARIPKKLGYSQTQINLAKEIRATRMGGFPTTGENELLVILANFSDTYPIYTQANFNNMMNQNNYSGVGSFKQYYLEVSYGQLTVNATVVGWVDVPFYHDYYGAQERWAEFARDAVEAADPLVDYSDFDNDGDGRVDGVAIYHQGRGQETTGDTSDIWSHNFSLTSAGYFVNLDGVQISDYTMQAEQQYWSMSGIGVIAHEFGHNLGTPDFYDTDYQTNGSQDGTGEWDIMGSGAYNGGGDRPAHHNMWSKSYFGWVEPQELYYDGSISIPSSTTNPVAYYFTTPVNGEYMLMENVQQTGFNASVPGNGLLIYHADENWITSHFNQNNINTTSHQGFYVVSASGSTNSASATFPTYSATAFTDNSYPSIPSWGNYDVSKGLNNITKTGGVVNFNFFDNSAYTPQVTFTNLMNNEYFQVGDEVNLDIEIDCSIEAINIDMVEVFVNGVTQYVHLAEPYNYSLTTTMDHYTNNAGLNQVLVRTYTNFQTYDAYTYFNVLGDQPRLLEQFEDFDDFALNFGDWETLDNDNQETIQLPNYDYPNLTEPKSFMIFNPNETSPFIREIQAYSGDKMAVAFSNSTEVANNDWLISPEIDLSVDYPDEYDAQMNLSLNVLGSYEDGELFNVYYSTSESNYEDWITLTENPLEAQDEWTNISYLLPADEIVKVAIQVVSTGGSFVMVDDISVLETYPVSNDENEIESISPLRAFNYPNPFNPETTISFNMIENGPATVQVYNLRGQLVKTLLNDQVKAGNQNVVWKGKDANNKNVASGIYFYRITTPDNTIQKKMILQK